PGQQWRRRGVFFADDAWSYRSGYVVADTCEWKSSELAFENSEDLMATWWESLADIGLTTTRYFVSDYLDPYLEPGQRLRHTVTFRDHYRYGDNDPWGSLIDVLSEGALFVHYQGHANAKLLAHEYVLWDEPYNKRDLSVLANTDKPWVFYGMGCHVSDWAQNTVKSNKVVEPSIGEKMLVRNRVGSVATYGSCGYEYLTENARFSELQLNRYVFDPPTTSVSGAEIRSRWVLGELCWAAEADLKAVSPDARYRRMVAQYSLLGDALLNLNCGAPVVTTRLVDASGDTLTGDYELAALDESNTRTLQVIAADEAGTRLVLTRSDGADLSSFVTELFAPVISSTARTVGWIGQEYSYDVEATGLPVPAFALAESPDGMTIDSETGVISWMPAVADTFPVTVVASNRAGSDEQVFAIIVSGGPPVTGTAGAGRLLAASPPVTDLLSQNAYSRQRVTYELDLPIAPFHHTVSIEVYDTGTGSNGNSAYQLTLLLSQTATIYLDGQPVADGEIPFLFDVPLDLVAEVHTAAWLDPTWEMQLTGANLALSNVQFERRDDFTLDITFTATPISNTGEDVNISLTIDGHVTEIYGEGQAAEVPLSIGLVYAYPNPMVDQTRFLFRTGEDASASGHIQIYTLAGRHVHSLPVAPDAFSPDGALVAWDGRDEQGDRLANGVYLYRVELNTPAGKIAGDMQRLVMMR
ncbi:MAG: C25 family cysteine peptidase, partial [bacterium]